ncbi:MAG: hypothetical protein DWQ37_15955 [Planctomycetota bacterium]|nr:MAG: hypothetical protein DWQ37_15955 [Planctomycetota bacterium]
MLIEQAIFTSAATDRAQGYQLLARSPGLAESDARELAVWGPSHGSLLEQGGDAASTNYFRLGSGAHCVSRTSVAGKEYSGRGGMQVYTQFLVVPPGAMQRFANDPFAILRAAAASGSLRVEESVAETLEPIRLCGRAPVVDLALVARLARDPGPAALATLLQTALASDRLAVRSTVPCDQLVAGLLSLLPVECRGEFSFSTGLHFSPSRPVRILALPPEENSWRAMGRQGITVLQLDESTAAGSAQWQGWAAWITSVLDSGKLSVLATELEQPRPGLVLDDLDRLAEVLMEIEGGKPKDRSRKSKRSSPKVAAGTGQAAKNQRTDRAHGGGVATEERTRSEQLDALAARLARQPPEVLELLERIDDLVFAAISGDAQALEELEALWPVAAAELDPDLVEQTREQYLRCALSIYVDSDGSEAERPERAVSAVEVLCVLFEQ